jgi:ribosome maturation factor RimP
MTTRQAALEAKLEQLCEDSLKAVGYELVELEYLRDGHGWVLRVYIDHPEGGAPSNGTVGSSITHQDCERASRHLSAVLDVEDPIDTAYRLEVSSPGVRRPLRKESDFVRFSGKVAKVQLTSAAQGRKNFTGKVVSARDGVVSLEVDGAVLELPLAQIKKARLEVES